MAIKAISDTHFTAASEVHLHNKLPTKIKPAKDKGTKKRARTKAISCQSMLPNIATVPIMAIEMKIPQGL